MKITVGSGADIFEALQEIEKYLRGSVGRHRILNTNLNMYLTLRNEKYGSYYKNDDVVEIDVEERTAESIFDIFREKAIEKCTEKIYFSLGTIEARNRSLDDRIRKAKANIKRAGEKNFNTVEKWERNLRELMDEKENTPETVNTCSNVKKYLKSKEVQWDFEIKYNSMNCMARVSVRPKFVFGKDAAPLYYYGNGMFSEKDMDEKEWVHVSMALERGNIVYIS